MKTILLIIERQRTYGRRLCEGIIAFAHACADWNLRISDPLDIERALKHTKADGYIARILDDRMETLLRKTKRPVVDVFNEKPRRGFATVDQLARQVGVMAVRHFVEHHFTHFAFCGFNGRNFSDVRRNAFLRCLELNHYPCDIYPTPACALRDFTDSVLLRDRLDVIPDRNQLAKWLNGLPKPIALFCAHDLRAYHVMEVCHSLGIRIPEDLSILGVDDDELVCNFTTPTLSSIDQNAYGIGYAAAETLQKMLSDPTIVPSPRFIKPLKLVERESTRNYPLDPPWLSKALSFIRSGVSRMLTSSDVCTHVGKSHTTVEHAFREKLGTTIQHEIMRSRLEEAQRLLAETDLPLTEISRFSGFASASYFSTVFSAAYNRPPSSFRKTFGGMRLTI